MKRYTFKLINGFFDWVGQMELEEKAGYISWIIIGILGVLYAVSCEISILISLLVGFYFGGVSFFGVAYLVIFFRYYYYKLKK